MSQAPCVLAPAASPRAFFGAELRFWRERQGLSQDELGRRVMFSGDLIAKVEKALRWPADGLAEECDKVLATGGVLQRLVVLVRAQREHGAAVTPARLVELPAVTPEVDARQGHDDLREQVAALTAQVETLTSLLARLVGNGLTQATPYRQLRSTAVAA